MSDSLLNSLVDSLQDLLAPVVQAAEDGWWLDQLLTELGADLTAAGGGDLVAALKALAAFEQQIASFAADPSPSFASIANLLQSARAVFVAVRALSAGGGPAAKLPGIGEDLVQLMIGRYLRSRHPILFRLGVLLTVVESASDGALTPPVTDGDQVLRQPIALTRFKLGRLVSLLQDPVTLLRAEYVNSLATTADANAMADKLFPRVGNLLEVFGLPWWYGLRDQSVPLLGDAAPLMDHALTVYGEQSLDDGTRTDAGVTLAFAAADRGDLGLVVCPFGSLTLTQQLGNWTFEFDLTADVEAFAWGRRGATIVASPSTVEIDGSFSATLAAPSDGPAYTVGAPNGSRLEVGGAKVTAATSLSEAKQSFAFSAEVSKSAIIIAPGDGDGFLKSILPADGLQAKFDLGIGWSTDRGFTFKGAAGLDATLPLGISIGGVLTLPTVHLGLHANNAALATEVSLGIGAKIGPVQALVDRVGIIASLAFPDDGGNLGVADLTLAFKLPSGVGLSIDSAGVSGGGFLAHDDSKHEYSGVLQLQFNNLALQAFGLITTQVAGQSGYSLLALIDADFPPVQLGWGFTLDGVGGLLAVNRCASTDALHAALKANTLSSILFPKNAITNAAQILSTLDAIFPTASGRFIFGPMALIGWGTPTVLTISLALIVELPEPVRLMLLARLALLLPNPSEALVKIKMDALGVLDLSKSEFSLDATLYDSHLLSFSLSGDMALRANWGNQPEFLLAIGGFHPRFAAPPGFPQLRRMTIDMSSGIISTLRLRSYFALTSNTLQFGASLDVFIGVSGFGLEGHLGFDALFGFDPFRFDADISGSVALTGLMSVGLDATLSGPKPWHIAGSFKFSILFWDVHVSFSQTWGGQAEATAIAAVDVAQLLAAAFLDAHNWGAQLANGVPALVAARNVDAPGLVMHPLAQLELRERVVPLGLDITRFGAASPQGARRFDITGLSIGGSGVAHDAVEDYFAPAQFFELSDEEKLARPSFERHDAGLRFGFGIGAGADRLVKCGNTVQKEIAYETSYIDTPDGVIRPPASPPAQGVVQFVIAGGAADRAPMARAGQRKYKTGRRGITVAEPKFVVVDTSTLSVAKVGAAGGGAYSDMQAALDSELRRSPDRRGQLAIVALHEVGG